MGRAEILIVGGGVAGLATAYWLARRGARDVVLLEREPVWGAHSSGKNAAILRTSSSDWTSAALLSEGGRFLAAPPAEFSPVPLLDPVGLIVCAEPAAARALRRLAPSTRELDSDELARRAPHYLPEPGRVALYAKHEGRIDIAALVDGYARGARAGGVAIETGVEVDELMLEGAQVVGVRTSAGDELRARTTVLAAGGWAGALGARAGSSVELRPTRRHLLSTAVDARVDPRWPVVWDDVEGLYLRPESGGLLVCPCDQSDADPERLLVDPEVQELVAHKCAQRLPDFADAEVARLWCGLRTFSADQRFALGPDPSLPGLHWAAALGGHGMGASSALGRIAAARLLGAPPENNLERALDPARLARATSQEPATRPKTPRPRAARLS